MSLEYHVLFRTSSSRSGKPTFLARRCLDYSSPPTWKRNDDLNPPSFWPAYLTAERIAKAPKLKMALTAGIGSDHVDLEAACKNNITVAEVTYCNSISVSEHVVMMILGRIQTRTQHPPQLYTAISYSIFLESYVACGGRDLQQVGA